jgi:hypothetical protein
MGVSDETSSHPTKQPKDACQVVGYKYSDFAQMPHKGTPIRYGQKHPVRSRQQGVEKICEHPLRGLPAYPTSPRRICFICKQEIFYATQHNQRLGCGCYAAWSNGYNQ